MSRCLAIAANAFPFWVVLGALLALWHPPWFVWFRPFIVPGLAVIMLGMGLTLQVSDFRRALRMPRTLAVGFAAQFTAMPFLGWCIAHTLQLERDLAVGLILVACCPGGTASNVVTYLARAHVALSVLLTMASTFGAILMTPLLTQALAGTLVPVPALKLFLDTVQVVLLPVLAGIALHHRFPRWTRAILPLAPVVSVLTIAMICAAIIGLNADLLRRGGGRLLLAVGLLHAGGFTLGYVIGRLAGYDALVRRTLSIEVGMQNSGLGVVLADNFRNPVTGIALAAVPCAVSATVHSVFGSLLAGVWRLRTPPAPPP